MHFDVVCYTQVHNASVFIEQMLLSKLSKHRKRQANEYNVSQLAQINNHIKNWVGVKIKT